jgi:Domain of unknown function (DUF1707)
MASDPSIRASDQDRDRTAHQLREHHAAGRLDPEEFNERLDAVYGAKTIADLDRLTADLPAVNLYPLPDAALPRDRVVRTELPASYVGAGVGARARAGARADDDPVGSALAKLSSGTGRFSPGWIAGWAGWSALVIIGLVIWILGGGGWALLGAGVLGAIMGVRWAAGPGILGRHSGPQGHLDSRPPDQLPRSTDT